MTNVTALPAGTKVEGEPSTSFLNSVLKALGDNCRQARKRMGLSQIAAAQAIGVDYRHYQNVEGGKINVRIDTLLLLMQFYGIAFAAFPQPKPMFQGVITDANESAEVVKQALKQGAMQ